MQDTELDKMLDTSARLKVVVCNYNKVSAKISSAISLLRRALK